MTRKTKMAPAERAAKIKLLATLDVLSPEANAAACAARSAKGSAMTGHICPDGRHDERAAAHYLGIQPGTLRAWRSRDHGPAYVKAGRIWYYLKDLDAWLVLQRHDPASDQE